MILRDDASFSIILIKIEDGEYNDGLVAMPLAKQPGGGSRRHHDLPVPK
jgi:hypothetical protein